MFLLCPDEQPFTPLSKPYSRGGRVKMRPVHTRFFAMGASGISCTVSATMTLWLLLSSIGNPYQQPPLSIYIGREDGQVAACRAFGHMASSVESRAVAFAIK